MTGLQKIGILGNLYVSNVCVNSVLKMIKMEWNLNYLTKGTEGCRDY